MHVLHCQWAGAGIVVQLPMGATFSTAMRLEESSFSRARVYSTPKAPWSSKAHGLVSAAAAKSGQKGADLL